MNSLVKSTIYKYDLDPECMRRFAKAALGNSYLVLPPGSGLYSQVHRAWEYYCLQMGLPIILVEDTANPGSGGEGCTRVHVYTNPFRFYRPTAKLGVCHSLLEGLSPWEQTCHQAIDKFGFDHPRAGCDPTGVTFHNLHWTSFNNFPSAKVEALAMFLQHRVREHRAQLLKEEEEKKRSRKEVRG